MRKLTALIITLAFLSSYAANLPKKNDLAREGLKGKVKSVRTIGYLVIEADGEIEKGEPIPFMYVEYNDKGNRLEEKLSSPDRWHRIIYIYDDNGNKIEEKKSDSTGNILNNVIYTYNKKGNQIEKSGYKLGKYNSNNIYTYNNKGYLIKEGVYEKYREFYSEIIYTYDKKGRVIEKSHYGFDKEFEMYLLLKYIYTYNKKGNRIEEKEYNTSNEKLTAKNTFTYNKKGNIVEEKSYSWDNKYGMLLIYRYIYTYDKKGNRIEMKRYLEYYHSIEQFEQFSIQSSKEKSKLNYIEEFEIEYY